MTSKKLTITDKRMLQLPGILKAAGKINYKKEFIAALKMSEQNYYAIAREEWQHFTAAQVRTACKKYGIDGNWVLGFKDDRVFRGGH